MVTRFYEIYNERLEFIKLIS